MHKQRISVRLVALVVSIGVAACGQTATPPSLAVPLSSDAVAAPSESPILSPSKEPASSASPKPAKSTASPTPRPRSRPARWARTPKRIFSGYCSSPAATVDGSGRFHVAAICEGRIRYATSTNGRSWKASTLPAPSDGYDEGLHFAVDGSTLSSPIPTSARSTRIHAAAERSTKMRSASSTGRANFRAVAGRSSLASDTTVTISSHFALSTGSSTRPSGPMTALETCSMRPFGDRRSIPS